MLQEGPLHRGIEAIEVAEAVVAVVSLIKATPNAMQQKQRIVCRYFIVLSRG
jgi:hypothetical protein